MSKGPHYPLIQRSLPDWLRAAHWPRARALSRTPLTRLPEFIGAGPQAPLKLANARAWATQNSVDLRLKDLQDLRAFARPLLTQAIKERYGLDLDVDAVHLFLHTERGLILKGTSSHTVSLLGAALHNFGRHQKHTDSSSYISKPDARGHFMIEPLKGRMSIEQFAQLCRELDLGGQYQTLLKQHLLPTDALARQALQAEVIASQQAALDRAAHLALLKRDIDATTFALVQLILQGKPVVMHCYRLSLRGALLTGIVLIAANLESASTPVPILAYIPNDPQGALKHYADSHAFMNALNEKLRDADYQSFFSQFVDQSQRGHFFSARTMRTAFAAERIDADLWPYLYQRSLDKILNDAQELAVPTQLADKREFWAWWDNFSRIVTQIFDAALFVATPFVPFLGELTLAYTAYQLLDEVVEGVVDLAQGHALEAARHLVEVVEDVVQLGAFGLGGQLARSAFVDQLKAVDMQGRARLWNPDPRPYRQPEVNLAPGSTPDERGLHTHQGQTLLPVDEHYYAVEHDPAADSYRIRHPLRADAYAPPLVYNDSPRAWSDRQLARSLGDFSEPQARQILTISGTDYDVLRAARADNTTPTLLAHSIKRFELNQQAHRLPERLRSGQAIDEDTYWSPHMARELPGWPANRAIEVYDTPELDGDRVRYGEADAEHVLKISRQDLNLGQLPERLAGFLDDTQLQEVLGEIGEADPVDALRNRMADNLDGRREAVFDYLYRHSEEGLDTAALRVRQAVGELPKTLARQVIAQARPAELAIIEQHVPLRLRNLARELQLQARGVHAVEGLTELSRLNADGEQMVLDALRLHSDALRDTRLEIRLRSPTGPLRASAGATDARRVRVLVKHNDAEHVIHDGQQRILLRNGAFFEAILHALPLDRQAALGFVPGESEGFRAWMVNKVTTPEQRRVLFESPGIGPEPTRDALVLTQKPMHRAQQWCSALFAPTLEERVKALYPYAEQTDIDAFLPSLDDPDNLQGFEAREAEKLELQSELNAWINLARAGEEPSLGEVRRNLARSLTHAWELNFKPNPHGITLTHNGAPLGGLLGNLRLTASFDHVQRLVLIEADLLDSDMTFLENFPRLASLDLQGNGLTRLPQPVSRMISLRELTLDNNPLQWDAAGMAQFRQLHWLWHLSLGGNRLLTVAPDISGMPFLHTLSLRGTGISDWPEGLFTRQRPANFELDLQNTLIDHVPQFLPWQPEAELVARARLDRNRLSAQAEQTLVSYRVAAGLDPYRTYPPRGDAGFWLALGRSEHRPWLQELWDEVEAEHGSQGFFEVLKSLEPPEVFEDPRDRLRYEIGYRDLAGKVWQLLIAMQGDEALRTRLFLMASNPVTCADAGLHVFNALGVEFKLTDITHNLSGVAQERELARLAKGKARLERLNQVAQADVRQRIAPVDEGGQGLRFSTQVVDGEPGRVDEVEVYLAYQSALKQRLALPWVSEHMTYRATAQVSPAMIDAAHESVLALEAGDGLVDGMLAQGFWDSYLRTAHAEAFQASIEQANQVLDPLDDLMFAQKAWAASTARSDEAKQALLSLADALSVPHEDVLTGEPMTPQTYERILAGSYASDQDLARRLTREALDRLEEQDTAHTV
ncbi:NEL-type E3 ubiquitin ligase domain-containing protein [Pseudomonas cedrina]|uniref:NEL-type E3 ubiquitin ligase domain-containing protein n=1 Tax=Pseudomonas cedrina TaxID=651740 RepID=UPI003EDAB6A8